MHKVFEVTVTYQFIAASQEEAQAELDMMTPRIERNNGVIGELVEVTEGHPSWPWVQQLREDGLLDDDIYTPEG